MARRKPEDIIALVDSHYDQTEPLRQRMEDAHAIYRLAPYDAGEGYQYRIQSNSATDATTSGKVDIYLYDPIVTTLTTASDIAITGNLWNGVIGCTAGTDYIMSGVTARTMQSGYFGWVQTTGVATILADGTIAIGDNLTLSDGLAGAVQLKDAETEPLVGQALFAPDNTGHVGVRLYGLE